MPATARASSPSSSPDIIQMTNAGIVAVTIPASRDSA